MSAPYSRALPCMECGSLVRRVSDLDGTAIVVDAKPNRAGGLFAVVAWTSAGLVYVTAATEEDRDVARYARHAHARAAA